MEEKKENFIFLKKMIRNPRTMGAIMPSSQNLGQLMCSFIPRELDHKVIEIGAGTGSLTRALLKRGVHPKNLIVIELDLELCEHLQKKFSDIQIIHGDASHIETLIPALWVGKVGTIISGIPMVNFSYDEQKKIIDSCTKVMNEQGQILQFTYGPLSPLPAKRLGLYRQRLGHVFFNMPPAYLWRFTKTPYPLIAKPNRLKPHVGNSIEKLRKLNLFRRVPHK